MKILKKLPAARPHQEACWQAMVTGAEFSTLLFPIRPLPPLLTWVLMSAGDMLRSGALSNFPLEKIRWSIL